MQTELSDLKVSKAAQEATLVNCQKDLQIKLNQLDQLSSTQKESRTNEADLVSDVKKA